jgi:hypothetical protein
MRVTALICALAIGGVGLPLTPALAQATQTLEDVRDQGILYFKKDHLKQAKAMLDRAYAMPNGPSDFLTVYFRARTAYKLLLLEQAFEMGRKAETLVGDDEKKKATVTELLTEMSSLYGGVTFTAAKGETNKKGRIFFEAKTGIINKDKKQRFNAIRERYRSTDIELPTTIYLPYGAYTANKVPFALKQGEEPPEVEIFLQVVVSEGGADDSALWWWVGIGSGIAAVGLGVGAYFLFQEPDPEERSIHQWSFENANNSLRVRHR